LRACCWLGRWCPLIRVEELGVRRGHEPVLFASELTVGDEVVALMGPNGAGKTTLLQTLDGQLNKSGEIEQDPSTFLGARPPEPVDMQAVELVRAHGAEDPKAWLARVGYEGPELVSRGSAGERALVGLAGALSRSRDLLLDEPFGPLDPPHTARVWPRLADHAEDHAVLLATHDPAVAARADRVVLLAGTIVAQGPPREVLAEEPLSDCYGAPVEIAWTDLGPVVRGRERSQ
jgi:iron complex transport system ATP-binding protein